jgi:hypothetical protein
LRLLRFVLAAPLARPSVARCASAKILALPGDVLRATVPARIFEMLLESKPSILKISYF